MPDNWIDQSMNVFSFAVSKCNGSFVITRDNPEPNESLSAYMDRQYNQLDDQLKKLTLLRREKLSLDGRQGELLEFTWSAPEGVMRHLQFTAFDKGWALTFTLTAKDQELNKKMEDYFYEVLSSFAFR